MYLGEDEMRKCFDSDEQYMDFVQVLAEGIERVDILDIPDTETDLSALPLDDNQTLIVITAHPKTLFYCAVNAPVAAVDAAFEFIDGTAL